MESGSLSFCHLFLAVKSAVFIRFESNSIFASWLASCTEPALSLISKCMLLFTLYQLKSRSNENVYMINFQSTWIEWIKISLNVHKEEPINLPSYYKVLHLNPVCKFIQRKPEKYFSILENAAVLWLSYQKLARDSPWMCAVRCVCVALQLFCPRLYDNRMSTSCF